MKLRAKIILTAASLALSGALLAGCGSSSGSTASSAASSEPASTVLSQASSIPLGEDNSTDALNAPFETLLDANPISNQFEIAAMNIEYDFNLPAEDVVSYKGVKSNDNGDAGLVLVIEAADGRAEDIANQLTAYQQDQVAFYGNYAEFAQAQSNVENAIIDGGYDPIYGARPLKRYIQSHVETMIAKEIIGGAHTAGDTLTVDADGNGQLVLR